MTKKIAGFLLLSLLIFQSSALGQAAAKPKSPAYKAAQNITSAQLKDYLYFIASDAMEGRDTPSRGLDTAAFFLGTMLSRWGFKPAGDDGSFYQKIALKSETIDTANSSFEVNGKKLAFGEDFLRIGGLQAEEPRARAIYGGRGWMIKSKGIDDLKGIDVKGKMVVVYTDSFSRQFIVAPPKGVVQADLPGEAGEVWADPISNLSAKGAAGIVVVFSPDAYKGIWPRLRNFLSRGRVSVEKFPEQSGGGPFGAKIPTYLVSPKAGEAIFEGESGNPLINADTAAFEMKADKIIAPSFKTTAQILSTQNVVAIWEGSDPVLKNEMVAVGAHYDHVGIAPDSKDDKIYNGADDDGSGTVAVLSMAEALAKSPKRPKRSILLVWHAGEEKGLWGSEYFTKFPTVAIDKVIAQLNIDMIGRSKKANDTIKENKDLSGENEIYVIGSKMMSTKLGEITESINKSFLNLTYNYKYDDPKDTNRFFFRSDHFNYALKGIPIAFWFDGVHQDYHGLGDEAQKIDYVKMEKIARTIFLTMWELGDLKERPRVDKELPKELRQR